MDSRDILILGAVAVAAFLYYRAHKSPAAGVPTTGPDGSTGYGNMTTAGAMATTPPLKPPVVNQIGNALQSGFRGFSAINMGPLRFAGSTAMAVVADTLPPAPVTRPPVVSSSTVLGGASVYPKGAADGSPQPPLTHIVDQLVSRVRY